MVTERWNVGIVQLSANLSFNGHNYESDLHFLLQRCREKVSTENLLKEAVTSVLAACAVLNLPVAISLSKAEIVLCRL